MPGLSWQPFPTAAKRMETAAFVTELRQRLHMPDSSCDAWCPKCNGVLDTHSLHAGQRPEATGDAGRRPADVFVPTLASTPAALDLAEQACSRQGISLVSIWSTRRKSPWARCSSRSPGPLQHRRGCPPCRDASIALCACQKPSSSRGPAPPGRVSS